MSLASKAKALADPGSPESQAKIVSDLERKLSSEQAKSRKLNLDLARLASERDSVAERLDLLLETTDKVQVSKLSKFVKKKATSPATAILCCNDWHAEERIDADMIGGLNEFNLDIAEKRIKRTFEKAIYLLDFTSHVAKIDNLVLWLGGDLISGAIHVELEETNFLGPAEAILWTQQQVSDGINRLLPHFKHITVVTSFGNHGRTLQKPRITTGYRHSWEWLAYQNLAMLFAKDPKVTFKVERGYHNWLDIQGRAVRFHHGDAIKFMGGVGGWGIPTRKKISQWNKAKKADLDIIGHAHSFLHDWNYVHCGCLVGFNSFAQWIGAEFQPPTQTFMVMDKGYGLVACLPIFVEST